MKKVLAFAGSNSSTSINHELVTYISKSVESHEVKILKLSDYQIPMYSIDIEKERGFPVDVQVLKNIITEHDALIISVNEHNGTVSAFFKNILDWLSRVDRRFLENKKILLMSTSTGARGAASALEYSKKIMERFGGQVVENFSLPSFNDNFKEGKIDDEVLQMGINDVITTFAHEIEN